jgi:hypothetical protein
MKKILSLALSLLVLTTSCKKNDNNIPGCETTVAGIAGNYKLTKLVASANGINTDITYTIDACALNALYQLKADKTIVYTESGTCSNSAVGTWDVVDSRITARAGTFNFTDSHIDNNCPGIAITQPIGGAAYITAFTRQ